MKDKLDRKLPVFKKKGFEIQEKRVSDAVPGGKQTRGSGCSRRPAHKSDVISDLFRIESKTTEKGSISVERKWLEKIAREADMTWMRPALSFGFDGERAGGSDREDWLAFQLSVATRLIRIAAAVERGDFEEATRETEMLRTP